MAKLRQIETVSKPTNSNFYNLFKKSSSVTALIGYFGQLVSGVTEFHFIFSASGGTYHFAWSNLLPFCLGLLAVYIFEVVGVRTYLVRIIRQIANKEFNGSESWILFAFNLLFVLALCGSNIWFSTLGQKATFHAATNVTTTDKTHGLELEKTTKLDAIESRYTKQLQELKTTYQTDKQEISQRYESEIKELKNSRYTHRENKSKYDSYTAKIDGKLETKAVELQELNDTYESDKTDLKNSTENQKTTIANGYDKRINDIEKVETSNIDLWATVQRYTMPILIIFILLSWLAIVYNEVFYKGAGQKVEIQEKEQRPLLIVSFFIGIYEAVYYFFYWIVSFIVSDKKVIYSDFRQHEVKYENTYAFRKENDEKNNVKIAASTRQTIGFRRNKVDNSRTLQEFQSDFIDPVKEQNINNNVNTSNSSTQPKTQPNLDLKLDDLKPLNGERLTVNVGTGKVPSNPNLGTNQRICLNPECKQPFTYKHWNKKYCCDDCRIRAWEIRNNKTFKKMQKS